MVKGLLRVTTAEVLGDRYVVNGVVERDYNGMSFKFRDDGYFNMTHAAKHFGKQVNNFWIHSETKGYMDELNAALSKTLGANELELVQSKAGRYGGTWAHPKLAVFFARWLDVKFAVFCDMVIDDLIGGHATITVVNPEKAIAHKMPQTYLESLQKLIVAVQVQEKLQLQLQIEIKECIGRSLVVAVLAANYVSPWIYLAPHRTS